MYRYQNLPLGHGLLRPHSDLGKLHSPGTWNRGRVLLNPVRETMGNDALPVTVEPRSCHSLLGDEDLETTQQEGRIPSPRPQDLYGKLNIALLHSGVTAPSTRYEAEGIQGQCIVAASVHQRYGA